MSPIYRSDIRFSVKGKRESLAHSTIIERRFSDIEVKAKRVETGRCNVFISMLMAHTLSL
jgi:hypothetical protein